MGVDDRKSRQRAEREAAIVAAARRIASQDGWEAVTIRRLAAEIEYSQPVLYSHFANRDAIVAAVAIAGFGELAASLRQVRLADGERPATAAAMAHAYLAFARQNPALYDAMFTLPTQLRFARSGGPPEPKEAFAALMSVVPPADPDAELTTETFWSALHGLAELERSGRIRTSARDARVMLVVDGLIGCSRAD